MKMIRIVCTVIVFCLVLSVVACQKDDTANPEEDSDDITVEFLLTAWHNTPVPDDGGKNLYKAFVDNKFGIDFIYSTTSDLQTEIVKRYSSNSFSKPDVIIFSNADFARMKNLYDQGFFVEDYTGLLESMPTYKAGFDNNPNAMIKLTENGKLIALTQPAEEETWGFKIRQDWIDKYAGGKMPTTPDELLTMARAVKAENNKLYLFTSAGMGDSLGSINNLQYMYGPNGFYINDNTVAHPLLNGDRKKFLDFVKTLYDEGLIYPDWFTQSWENKKSALYTDRIGIDWYCAEIATEAVYMNGGDESKAEPWVCMPMPKDPDSPLGGQSTPVSTINRFVVITKECASNTAKLEKVLKLLDDGLYPNETYFVFRWGVDVDNYNIDDEIIPVPDVNGGNSGFFAYFTNKNKDTHLRSIHLGYIDYGAYSSTRSDNYIEYYDVDENNVVYSTQKFIELRKGVSEQLKTNPSINYSEILNINPRLDTQLTQMQLEFEINYIIGVKSDYDGFVSEWKTAGGDTVIAAATQQFKNAGLIE